MARTPISTAESLLEHARRLLLRSWPHPDPTVEQQRPLQAMQLEVSEFAPPQQLSFAELNRFDQAGALGGLSVERRHVLAEQDEALSSRYGQPTFRYVAHLDPANILTERRFRWAPGFAWENNRGAGRPVRRRA
jgi:hypothetical protein